MTTSLMLGEMYALRRQQYEEDASREQAWRSAMGTAGSVASAVASTPRRLASAGKRALLFLDRLRPLTRVHAAR